MNNSFFICFLPVFQILFGIKDPKFGMRLGMGINDNYLQFFDSVINMILPNFSLTF